MSPRPMAVSSDVILTSRDGSAELIGRRDRSATTVQTSNKQLQQPVSQLTDTDNAAACYGVDTVHHWATVPASRHQQLSGWRSDVDIHARSQAVCLITSPVQQTGAALSSGISVPDVREPSLHTPVPPPRTKRKARATLHTSPDHGMSCVQP